MADKYEITITGGDSFSNGIVELDLDEYKTIIKVFNSLKRFDEWSPTITIINRSAIERDKLKKEKIEKARKKAAHKEDVLTNGVMAVAFKKAMENKKEL